MAYNPSLFINTITLTSAQIKALDTTPIEVIPAPNSPKFINLIGAVAQLNYGGTNAFVGTGSSIGLYYTDNMGQPAMSNLMGNGDPGYASAQSVIQSAVSPTNLAEYSTTYINKPVVVALTPQGGGNITGNAANNNTITIGVSYQVVSL